MFSFLGWEWGGGQGQREEKKNTIEKRQNSSLFRPLSGNEGAERDEEAGERETQRKKTSLVYPAR